MPRVHGVLVPRVGRTQAHAVVVGPDDMRMVVQHPVLRLLRRAGGNAVVLVQRHVVREGHGLHQTLVSGGLKVHRLPSRRLLMLMLLLLLTSLHLRGVLLLHVPGDVRADRLVRLVDRAHHLVSPVRVVRVQVRLRVRSALRGVGGPQLLASPHMKVPLRNSRSRYVTPIQHALRGAGVRQMRMLHVRRDSHQRAVVLRRSQKITFSLALALLPGATATAGAKIIFRSAISIYSAGVRE